MKNKKELKYIIAIIILVIIYVVVTILFPSHISIVSTVITTTAALIAAVTFWLQLKRSQNLDEANFIMDLNDQFISNNEMTEIEHALELYYNKYVDGHSNITLDLTLERDHSDCQKLINYLVYMEGLAALVQRDVMHLGVIDDLFAYRFFIAVNNPIVQKFELLPYANYYQGCFKLSKMWTNKWREEKREIPLDHHALFESDINQTDRIYVRPANPDDDFHTIAKCVYQTDPYIYPAAFGPNEENAITAIKSLMNIEKGLFSTGNYLIAFCNDTPCGILLYNKDGVRWETAQALDAVKNTIPDTESFVFTADNYFSSVAKATHHRNIEVVACSVLSDFRDKGIGRKLLNWLIEEYPNCSFTLDVLAENSSAIALYKKSGFVVEHEIKGFSIDEANRPDCYRMIRQCSKAGELT